MKKLYIQPAAEELKAFPASALLDVSTDGELESYGDQNDFTW